MAGLALGAVADGLAVEAAESASAVTTEASGTFRSGFSLNEPPGMVGIDIPGRLTDSEMLGLSEAHGGIEFAQLYKIGPGRNGGGGRYWLFSGDDSGVQVPLGKDWRYINHTHPNGASTPSFDDTSTMAILKRMGNPQRTSTILPAGKPPIKFNAKGPIN